MPSQPITVEISPGHADATAEELSKTAIDVRMGLLELPVDDVYFVRDREAPAGAKAASAADLGQLIVLATPASALLASIVAVLRAKIRAGTMREVRITISGDTLELKGIAEHEQQKLISAWISNNVAEAGPDGKA